MLRVTLALLIVGAMVYRSPLRQPWAGSDGASRLDEVAQLGLRGALGHGTVGGALAEAAVAQAMRDGPKIPARIIALTPGASSPKP